ncbi:hypothetical protein [Saccharicrinis sp. GN24d3]|uniref:hypothetical protein n=1 Tax=Saccharicrinis sp. GN24d3 TaxID=3458416 RepID=UPI00403639AF
MSWLKPDFMLGIHHPKGRCQGDGNYKVYIRISYGVDGRFKYLYPISPAFMPGGLQGVNTGFSPDLKFEKNVMAKA